MKKRIILSIVLIVVVVVVVIGCGSSNQSYLPHNPTPLFEHKEGDLEFNPDEFIAENYLQFMLDIGLCLSN